MACAECETECMVLESFPAQYSCAVPSRTFSAYDACPDYNPFPSYEIPVTEPSVPQHDENGHHHEESRSENSRDHHGHSDDSREHSGHHDSHNHGDDSWDHSHEHHGHEDFNSATTVTLLSFASMFLIAMML